MIPKFLIGGFLLIFLIISVDSGRGRNKNYQGNYHPIPFMVHHPGMVPSPNGAPYGAPSVVYPAQTNVPYGGPSLAYPIQNGVTHTTSPMAYPTQNGLPHVIPSMAYPTAHGFPNTGYPIQNVHTATRQGNQGHYTPSGIMLNSNGIPWPVGLGWTKAGTYSQSECVGTVVPLEYAHTRVTRRGRRRSRTRSDIVLTTAKCAADILKECTVHTSDIEPKPDMSVCTALTKSGPVAIKAIMPYEPIASTTDTTLNHIIPNHDIALIQLLRLINVHKSISPNTPLPPLPMGETKSTNGLTVLIQSNDAKYSVVPMMTKMTPSSECEEGKTVKTDAIPFQAWFCASVHDNNNRPALGSPFYIDEQGTNDYKLGGLCSSTLNSQGCIFTFVPHYAEWIAETVRRVRGSTAITPILASSHMSTIQYSPTHIQTQMQPEASPQVVPPESPPQPETTPSVPSPEQAPQTEFVPHFSPPPYNPPTHEYPLVPENQPPSVHQPAYENPPAPESPPVFEHPPSTETSPQTSPTK